MQNKVNIFIKVFLSLLLLGGLVGGFCFFMYYTNNFTTDLTTFYVQYGSSEYRQNNNTVTLKSGVTHSFDCNYIFGFPKNETTEHYFVSIVPNSSGDNFDYKLDGKPASYYPVNILDFSSVFNLVKYKDSFTIFIPDNLTMQSALNIAFVGNTVSEVPDVDLTAKEYFTLLISSYDGKTQIKINFKTEVASNVVIVT